MCDYNLRVQMCIRFYSTDLKYQELYAYWCLRNFNDLIRTNSKEKKSDMQNAYQKCINCH